MVGLKSHIRVAHIWGFSQAMTLLEINSQPSCSYVFIIHEVLSWWYNDQNVVTLTITTNIQVQIEQCIRMIEDYQNLINKKGCANDFAYDVSIFIHITIKAIWKIAFCQNYFYSMKLVTYPLLCIATRILVPTFLCWVRNKRFRSLTEIFHQTLSDRYLRNICSIIVTSLTAKGSNFKSKLVVHFKNYINWKIYLSKTKQKKVKAFTTYFSYVTREFFGNAHNCLFWQRDFPNLLNQSSWTFQS